MANIYKQIGASNHTEKERQKEEQQPTLFDFNENR